MSSEDTQTQDHSRAAATASQRGTGTRVLTPMGQTVTFDDLPPVNTTRLVTRRKAAVVEGVRAGLAHPNWAIFAGVLTSFSRLKTTFTVVAPRAFLPLPVRGCPFGTPHDRRSYRFSCPEIGPGHDEMNSRE